MDSENQGEQGVISINNTGTLDELELIYNKNEEKIVIGVKQSEKKMIYEIQDFIRVIEEKNRDEYETLKYVRLNTPTITESVRK